MIDLLKHIKNNGMASYLKHTLIHLFFWCILLYVINVGGAYFSGQGRGVYEDNDRLVWLKCLIYFIGWITMFVGFKIYKNPSKVILYGTLIFVFTVLILVLDV